MNNGYIRKIDDLGRVVIPKEVRKKLSLHDNENVIISYDSNGININKFSYLDKYNMYLESLVLLIDDYYNIGIELYDRDKLVVSNNINNRKYLCEYDLYKDSVSVGLIKFYSNNKDYNIIKFLVKLINLYFNAC